ncbi:hypothetical protein ABIC60_004579 [Phyllobacterium ifriqiyense]
MPPGQTAHGLAVWWAPKQQEMSDPGWIKVVHVVDADWLVKAVES